MLNLHNKLIIVALVLYSYSYCKLKGGEESNCIRLGHVCMIRHICMCCQLPYAGRAAGALKEPIKVEASHLKRSGPAPDQ